MPQTDDFKVEISEQTYGKRMVSPPLLRESAM